MKLIYRLKQLMLMTGDLVAFCFGFWLSLLIRYQATPSGDLIIKHFNLFSFIFLAWLIINYINNLYNLAHIKEENYKNHFLQSALIALIFSVLLIYIFPEKNVSPKTILVLSIFLGYGFSHIWRIVFSKYINTKTLLSNVIFVGFSKEIEELTKILLRHPERGYKTIAIIDHANSLKSMDFPFFDIYHGLKTLRPAITNHNANLVVVEPNLKEEPDAMRELYELLFWDVKITDTNTFYETITGRIPPSVFSEGWFLEHLQNHEPVYEKLRRIYDFITGVTMGIFFLFILPFVAIGIKLSSKGSIFFIQTRVGKFGKIFNLYKFRSMYSLSEDGSAELDGAEFAQKNDKRITTIGKFLRQTRLDELPQFFNLLKGDISLIGPRPERPEIVEQLKAIMPYYPLRHIIKPGITGWAAVHQHYTDTLETSLQKLQYDLYYIKNRSLVLDISIILKTVNVVMRMMGQ